MKIIMHFNYIKIAKADTSCNEENKSISEKSRRNNFTLFWVCNFDEVFEDNGHLSYIFMDNQLIDTDVNIRTTWSHNGKQWYKEYHAIILL